MNHDPPLAPWGALLENQRGAFLFDPALAHLRPAELAHVLVEFAVREDEKQAFVHRLRFLAPRAIEARRLELLELPGWLGMRGASVGHDLILRDEACATRGPGPVCGTLIIGLPGTMSS